MRTIYKIDNYSIKKEIDKTADVNYNTNIRVFLKDRLISGWNEKEDVKDIEILEAAINSIKRYEKQKDCKTLEEFLCTT